MMSHSSQRGNVHGEDEEVGGDREKEENNSFLQPPGTAYVYSIYGVHHCFNVSSRGSGAAVLVRALRPVAGLETMSTRRGDRRERDLCSGPGKLCQALAIDKRCISRKSGRLRDVFSLQAQQG